jgi:hypothetical protein
MINNGMFSTLFIQDLSRNLLLDDAAVARMDTLAQTWGNRDESSAVDLWNSFLKQALGNLEFVCPQNSHKPDAYLLYEDWGFSNDIAVLYLVEPGGDVNDASVGKYYPAKLMSVAREQNLNWGVLTNGSVWRLYSLKSSRPFEDFVELDLGQALENGDEQQYALFERFFHKDSFVALHIENDEQFSAQDVEAGVYKCRLDMDQKRSEDILEKEVKNPFLRQVDEVLQYICNGFIYATRKSGEDYTEEERQEIFQSAVKLIYRCLFMFYAESRSLLPSDPDKAILYQSHSMQNLCMEAHKFRWGKRRDTDGYDLWKHLQGLINAVNEGDPEYGIMGYNGGLFDDRQEIFLGRHELRNDFLSRALYLLAFVEPLDDDQDKEYPIPYRDLEVRHLGELYENILEYTVQLADADRIRRITSKGYEIILASGSDRKPGDRNIRKGEVFFGESALERKQTGSYYTPESLVKFLNQKAIIEPLTESFENKYRQRFNELLDQADTALDQGVRRGAAQSAAAHVERFVHEEVLNFKVCDPAMGSGHFLVNAANQMAGLVVSLLEEIPHVSGMRVSVTSQPNHWRRLITRHCIYGVDINPLSVDLAKLSLWLNCFAINHKLTFLDHHLRCGNSLIGIRDLNHLASVPDRKKNSKKNKYGGLGRLMDHMTLSSSLTEISRDIISISQVHEDETDTQKEMLDRAMRSMDRFRLLADLYTAYLMDSDINPGEYKPLFEKLAKHGSLADNRNPGLDKLRGLVEYYREQHRFFHWSLEFSDVLGPETEGGFSATIGNPPWDIVKPNSQEFFSSYDPRFRSYKKQEANKVAKNLMRDNQAVKQKWEEYCEAISRQSTYFKEPLNFQALGKGDINTFKLFLEQFFRVLTKNGSMGIIVPSGLYTDQGCQDLREMFFNKSQVEYLYCFENRRAVFNIHRSFKFVLFSAMKGRKTNQFKCAFMEHDPERLPLIDSGALKMSVEQVRKFSPQTLSVMEFKSQKDIDITSKIYGDWPLLGDKLKDTWNVKFRRELDMTNDSHLFKTSPTDCPLYEGKMIWHFDSHFDQPRYWLDREEAEKALGDNSWEGKHFRVGFRNVASSTNERTLVCGLSPPAFHGNSFFTITPMNRQWHGPNNVETLWIASIMSSLCIDFLIRQKVTTNLNYFYLETLPVPRKAPNSAYTDPITSKATRLFCYHKDFSELCENLFDEYWQSPDFWYPPSAPIDTYGPVHEQEIRKRLRDEAPGLTPEWGPHCGVHDRLPDRRDTGDRAQLRAEIDAYVAHLYGLSRDDFAYILDTFPVLKKKEQRAFGEFMSKRKCLEEYDRIGKVLTHEGSQ